MAAVTLAPDEAAEWGGKSDGKDRWGGGQPTALRQAVVPDAAHSCIASRARAGPSADYTAAPKD